MSLTSGEIPQFNYTIKQGDDNGFVIAVVNPNTGGAQNLTNYTVSYQIREFKDSASALLSLTNGAGVAVLAPATDGRIRVDITALQSAALSFNSAYHALDAAYTPTDPDLNTTIFEGPVTLNKDWNK